MARPVADRDQAEQLELFPGSVGKDGAVTSGTTELPGGWVSVRDLLRKEGVRPGVAIRFPAGAEGLDFWEQYPRDEVEFRLCVLPERYDEEGITFTARAEPRQERPLKDAYQGFPRQLVGRWCFLWRTDREGFSSRHSPRELLAVEEFLQDRQLRQEATVEERRRRQERQRPPVPPIGYRWLPDRRLPDWSPDMRYVLAIHSG